MPDLTAPADVRSTATQGADETAMRGLMFPGDEYVAHRKPTCVAPFLYVQPLITRSGRTLVGQPISYTVRFVWTDTREPLDRRITHGISTGADRPLANRLAAATEAGVIQSEARVLRDVDDQTYVQSRCAVLGKYLNADLKRLGF